MNFAKSMISPVKWLMMLAVALVMGAAVSACGDDDDEDSLRGLYAGEGTEVWYNGSTLQTSNYTIAIQFNKDKTGYMMTDGDFDLFNDFKIVNGRLFIRWTGDDMDDYDDEGAISIDGKTITLSDVDADGEGYSATLTRVNSDDNKNFDFWNYVD